MLNVFRILAPVARSAQIFSSTEKILDFFG
jgi:hypothetical protein